MRKTRTFETGGEILIVDSDILDVTQVDAIVWCGAGVRIDCQRGDVAVETDDRRVIVTLPGDAVIP